MVAPAAHNDDDIPMDPTNTTAYLVCTIVLLFGGLFGNLLLIGTVLTFKNLRSVNNIFITNLVLADCASLVLLDAFSILGIVKRGEGILNYGSRSCKVISYFYLSAMVCSVWSLASCAVHIYIRVCHKSLYKVIYTAQSVSVIIFWIWTLCPMIVLPSMMGWGSHGYDTRLMHCTFDYTASYSFTYFLLAMGSWIPFIIVAYCTIRTLKFIQHSKCEVQPAAACFVDNAAAATCLADNAAAIVAAANEEANTEPRQLSTTNDEKDRNSDTESPCDLCILLAVMAVTLSLLIGWATMTFIWLLDKNKQWGATEFVFAIMMANSPSSINGIVYAMVNKNFRRRYLRLSCHPCRMYLASGKGVFI